MSNCQTVNGAFDSRDRQIIELCLIARERRKAGRNASKFVDTSRFDPDERRTEATLSNWPSGENCGEPEGLPGMRQLSKLSMARLTVANRYCQTTLPPPEFAAGASCLL
jgi:hypothetical protein